jgi:hypothetical protein
MLAAGTLAWDGGTQGADQKQRLVPAAGPGITKVAATYTPNVGEQPVSTFARILVTAFTLEVTGAARAGGPGSTTFLARPDPAALVTVTAALDRTPEVLSTALVAWRGGDERTDPLRRTLSRARPARTEVSATVAGATRTVTVTVFDLSLVINRAPFTTVATDVLLEGLTNDDLRHVRLNLVLAPQNSSLFRARAEVPGVVGAVLPATLTSTAADGSAVETVNLVLNRSAPGSDVFLSMPILAVPAVIPRGDVKFDNPKTVEVIRALSGGQLTLRVGGMFAAESVRATVHARVLYLNIQVFKGSGVDVADVRTDHVPKAQRAWAQAGIEVKLRAAPGEVAPADEALLDLDHTDDKGEHLTGAEQQLVGRKEPSPARSAVFTDLNVYYLRSIGRPGGAAGGGTVKGIAYPNDPVIGIARAASDTALSHEIGHQLHQSHKDAAGDDWPLRNVMHPEDTGDQRDVDPAQATRIAAVENAQEQQRRRGNVAMVQRYLVREP